MKRISLSLLVLQGILVIALWRWLPPELPLFYSRPWGKQQLTVPWGLLLLPLLSVLVYLINHAGQKLVKTEDVFCLKVLDSFTLIYNLLSFIALIQIVRIII